MAADVADSTRVLAVGQVQAEQIDKQHPFVNSLGMKFVPVPIAGGKPVLFCIWKTRVKDFQAFVAETGYDATKDMQGLSPAGTEASDGSWKSPGFAQTELNPVCGVNYKDAVAFCHWLSKKERKHYRLPTDHEWSCAVGLGDRERASDTPHAKDRKIQGVYPWAPQWPPPKGAGNFAGAECVGQKCLPNNYSAIEGYKDGFIFTSPVGSFDPNPRGIYDLGGNLWEWCDDDWSDSVKRDRPQKVLRGGCWGDSNPVCLLSSFRRHEEATVRGNVFGFRVVLEESGEAK